MLDAFIGLYEQVIRAANELNYRAFHSSQTESCLTAQAGDPHGAPCPTHVPGADGGRHAGFADGGKSGLHARFRKTLWDGPGKSANKESLKANKNVLSIGYEQNSLHTRRRLVRGYLPQIESVLMIGPQIKKLPTKKRRIFTGVSSDTKGTRLAPAKVLGCDELWALSYASKKGIFESFRLRVGGPAEEDDDDAEDEVPPSLEELHGKQAKSKIKPRTSRDEGEEPVFYQSLKTKALWEEIIHTTSCRKAVVVFTGGDGTLLEACLELQPQHGPGLGFRV